MPCKSACTVKYRILWAEESHSSDQASGAEMFPEKKRNTELWHEADSPEIKRDQSVFHINPTEGLTLISS